MIGPPDESVRTPARNTDALKDNSINSIKALIGRKEAADVLDISVRKLWSLTKCGAIPSRRIDSLVKYSPAELHAWVGANCPTAPGSGVAVRRGMQQ